MQLGRRAIRGKNQRGDTIVEVLIAIGIESLVLVTAYATTNRNVAIMQNTREQTQAQKLVEKQIELLRAYPAFSGTCFSGSSPANGNDCKLKNNGSAAGTGYTGAVYDMNISKTSDTYTISAKWDKIGGSTGNVTMYYQL